VKRTGARAVILLVLALSALVAETPRTLSSVNAQAALRSLERSTSLLAAGDWEAASFEAQLGASYDPLMADFPYVEALSLAARRAPRADVIERVEAALADGLFWRSYSRRDALVFSALLYAQTRRHADALSTLDAAGNPEGADADYARLLALYGLGRLPAARELVARALERWPFDARFPRAFLSREASLAADRRSREIASDILARLYVWEDEDRELLILAVPFEHDPAARERMVRVYRGMGKKDAAARPGAAALHPLATLAALEYGIIDERLAIGELFSLSRGDGEERARGLPLADLVRLSRLVAHEEARAMLSSILIDFDGTIVDDADGDGEADARVAYERGRPARADFDVNQDGYPDFSVDCDNGSPRSIAALRGALSVVYHAYPDVVSVDDDRASREYVMRPRALKWAPVSARRVELGLSGVDFFAVSVAPGAPELTERLLVDAAAWYREELSDPEGAVRRVSLDKGMPVQAETRLRGSVYAWTSYSRGYPAVEKRDADGDGYFETTATYAGVGRLSSTEVDRNGNRKIEYREDYAEDGSTRARWDADEDGVFEVTRLSTTGGSTRTEWVHPISGLPVVAVDSGGVPRSVTYGSMIRQVTRDPAEDLYWIDRIPPTRDAARAVLAAFNQAGPSVVSVTVKLGGLRAHAVRTGGAVYAELIDE